VGHDSLQSFDLLVTAAGAKSISTEWNEYRR
jgi:hypothetical protein